MHNNHHAYPSSAKLSSKRWEFDIGWLYIRLFQGLGLVVVKRTAPQPVSLPVAKPEVDRETADAVARSRLHVMASYGRRVLIPTLRREALVSDAACRRLYRRARKAVIREASLTDQRARERLQSALETSAELRVVYEFKQRLQQLWDRSITSHDALVRQLQGWCNEAEATGIRALGEFARHLRAYALARPAAQ
ncbi:MAG: transposase [Ectothiorhodospiraceae bacterium]|nr:transposase [Ectothiorhodospiraceae bacterium]